MPSFETTRDVGHSAADMFNLVADVEKYPQFVPLCQNLIVRGRKDIDPARDILIADMTVAYKLFRETFTSKVTLDRDRNEILVEYLDGPFQHLENRWSFEPLGDTRCRVRFYISYDFKSRTLASLMGAMFDMAFRKFASAFEARADEVYGPARLA
ncbi:type II toxin-antitoxin system RatA family toxin [Microvirga tunisiensis]|uniref:Type II toxin-antitoxin system RatA family toxin n=2 Tax=Pannonibacter tanglangensis TaxID=2750084 RepID=A0ABW9ZBT6_9HYPH|nr:MULTISPECIES: type II toxin-antitoxin system RatA family toxin [unclassified Pannonibacter]NBN62111.1 type II toxin-antitoxin system RatA family toxin [Pannonibacter sp. XCT-34]NBN77781.1 type II toxin-antitoxin system RatA family toxin [Pannonibacter sp. XCT-53]